MSFSGKDGYPMPAWNTPPIQNFAIYWGATIYNAGVDGVPDRLDTFIHELTHVWQGYNEGSRVFNYMIRSLASQGWGIVSSLDRGNAYNYDTNNYLKWSDYNVEQ